MIEKYSQDYENHLMEFLHSQFGFEVFTPGLERTRKIYESYISLLKQRKVKVITIAGTNGKGQTAHTLAELIKGQGHSVGLWTSPHILSIKERFGFNDDLSYQELENEMKLAAGEAIGVSFYEFLFLVFLKLCMKRENITYLILEVGLGGRLDAVNHFDCDCALITSISRDHQAILGNTLREILYEKIAVARSEYILITSLSLNYLNHMVNEYCTENKIKWHSLVPDPNYFQSNIQLAQHAFNYFFPMVISGPKTELSKFKGRMEEMTFKQNSLIFIGAHNVEGMRKMLEHFSLENSENSFDVIMFSFSKRALSDLEVMLRMLTQFSKKFNKLLWPTFFNHPKAIDKEIFEKLASNNIGDWATKLEKYSSSNSNKKILVCGSYYFIGEVQRFLFSRADDTCTRDI